ncbi:MAG: FAD-binding protein, partial [Anaerolineae bacterium]|nr:FAD-binding protein [Anaerolineae bacterium]
MSKGTDILVIGAGLAGLTAAAHAIKAGASVRLIAQGWGQQIVAPGWISVWDRAEGDALPAAADHATQNADHPYALGNDLSAALTAFRDLTAEIGLPYDQRADGHNLRVPTMMGAIQTPLIAPRGIANGDVTDSDGAVLVVGFTGWRDFHPELAAQNLTALGTAARARRIALPGAASHWDRWPGDVALLTEGADVRAAIVRQLKSELNGVAKIGFPAVLGLNHHADVLADLTAQLERPIFEMPTLPPSVPGTRLSNRLRRWLLRHHARVQIGHPVSSAITDQNRVVGVNVAALGHTNPFYADQVILTTGGLYNGGIQSDVSGKLWEPIFDLPVSAPDGEGRSGWYAESLLDPGGHPIHRHAGLRVNAQMQPFDSEGAP